VLLTVAACSGEPGTAQITQAIRGNAQVVQSVQASLDLEARMNGKTPRTIEQAFDEMVVEKGQCVAASGAAGHVCDFRVKRTTDGQTTEGEWAKARFFEASGSWNLEVIR
jgi:hypothetical protein